MPKTKLTIHKDQQKKLELACELADVKIVQNGSRIFDDIAKVEVNFKTGQQLFEVGQYLIKDIKE